jgi:predicted metal-dependent phosphotriesterase family hydrolase
MHTALNGKVMTVLGAVTPEELGPVLMHEHLYLDLAASAEGPTPPERVAMLRDECAPLLKQMRELGGRSVVDCGAIPHRAEPAVYTMLAEMTGCHIVLATGFYRQASPDEQNPIGAQRAYRWLDERVVNGSVESLADIMVNEWDAGIRGTQVRPGIIKLAATGRRRKGVPRRRFGPAAHRAVHHHSRPGHGRAGNPGSPAGIGRGRPAARYSGAHVGPSRGDALGSALVHGARGYAPADGPAHGWPLCI